MIASSPLIVTVIVALSTTERLSVTMTRIVYVPVSVVLRAVTAPVELLIEMPETVLASLAF